MNLLYFLYISHGEGNSHIAPDAFLTWLDTKEYGFMRG